MPAIAGAPCRGQGIFAEGDKGDVMYVVQTGELSLSAVVTSWKRSEVAAFSARRPLIDGSPRSATVRAKTDYEVASIMRRASSSWVHETPAFAIAVTRALADRWWRMHEAIQVTGRRFLGTRHFWPFICGAPRP
jgi:CRP/FNR family cyclic AMP-dependent transcriptional regulator